MGNLILVAFVLYDSNFKNVVQDLESRKHNVPTGLSGAYALVSHFRVLDIEKKELLDISLDDYFSCDLDIIGLSHSKTLKSLYEKNILSNSNNLKYLPFNFNGVCELLKDARYSVNSYYNVMPMIYNNKPILWDECVDLSIYLDDSSQYLFNIVVNYVTGDLGIYLDRDVLIYGDSIKSEYYKLEYDLNKSDTLLKINVFDMFKYFDFNVMDGYLYNDKNIYINDFSKINTLTIPNGVVNVFTGGYRGVLRLLLCSIST